MFFGALIDILYAFLDPRIRLDMTDDGAAEPLLEVDDLQVSFATEDGIVQAVDGVSFRVDARRGRRDRRRVRVSGKSVTAMTLMGLTRGPNAKFEGTARFDGTELVTRTRATSCRGSAGPGSRWSSRTR